MDPGADRRTGWWLWAAVGATVAAVATVAAFPPARRALPPVAEKPALVTLRTVTPQTVGHELRLPGRLAPWREAVVAVEQEGVVVERAVDAGDRVSVSQVLARVDDRLASVNLARAEIEARDAAREARRAAALRESGAVSDADLDAAASRLARAEAGEREARTILSQCVLRAPFDGTIETRGVERGEFAARGKAAFRVVDTSRIKVIVHVGERDILCVRTGAAVPFFVASEAGCGRTGTVRFASQEADAASNTYTVELAAENADGRLRPGMIADVALDGGEVPHAVIVPLAAIVPRKGQQVIYVAEAGRAVPRAVQIESIRGADAVVREGLSPGDRLVVEGQRGLQDGMLLTETAPAAAAP